MVMRGIDISNWQGGMDLTKMPVDFAIMKATEGLHFVDDFCDGWVQQAKKMSMPWGFYHFAGHNDPVKEADFFYKNCKGYFGKGIPVLDYEADNANNAQWCEKFIRRVYDLTGVWCMLYISAYRCSQYRNSWIPKKCGLWVAGYPVTYAYWPTSYEVPYNVEPWETAAIWQFSSQVILHGYVGKLDGDLAYMDANQWAKYAGNAKADPKPEPKPKPTYDKTIDQLAREVIEGKHGTGAKRKKSLGKKYTKVQNRVDELYNIADEVIAGKWGNDWNRKQALKGAGYPYDLVQKIVNDKLA